LVLEGGWERPGIQRVLCDCLPMLAESPRLGNLRELNLSINTTLTGRELRTLSDSRSLDQLESLDLSYSVRSDEALLALAGGNGLPRLTALNLSGGSVHHDPSRLGSRSRFTLGAFTEFIRSPFVTRLHRLWLCRNALGLEGIKALTESPRLEG